MTKTSLKINSANPLRLSPGSQLPKSVKVNGKQVPVETLYSTVFKTKESKS